MEKKCAFSHARHIYSLENYFIGGLGAFQLWLTKIIVIKVNLMKFLSNVLKTLSTLDLRAKKKKKNSEQYFNIYSLVNL